MKKSLYYALIPLMTLGVTTGCSDDNFVDATGEGRLFLSTSIKADLNTSRTSSDDLAAELGESLLVWISTSNADSETNGLVRKFEGIDAIPSQLALPSGHYVVEGWAGDSVSASWTARYFKGVETFDITRGGATSVTLTCAIANVAATVETEGDVDDVLTNYTVTVGHSRGTLDFDAEHIAANDRGYFMMPSTDTDLTWTITGEDISTGSAIPFTKTGKITDVKAATLYKLKVKHISSSEAIGGAHFTIEVDETENLLDTSVTIAAAPSIEGFGYSLSDTQLMDPDNTQRRSVIILATSSIKSVLIQGDALQEALGYSDVDIISATDAIKDELATKGISWIEMYDEVTDATDMKLIFDASFFSAIPAGNYETSIMVTDANGRTSTAVLSVSLTKASIVMNPELPLVQAAPAYASGVELTATLANLDETNPGFNYRAVTTSRSEGEWTFVPATLDGNIMKATLTDLEEGVTYEYYPKTDQFDKPSQTGIYSFTTEISAQLPNAGFENWQDASAPYLIYGEGETKFWDSGNHGSATMSKNVTLPDATLFHSGKRSIKLESQFVGIAVAGKFAAGNVFAGDYLETLGMDGVLGWGRPFTARPRALRGYVRYEPKAVTHTSTSAKKKGDMDEGIVYIALLDDHTEGYTLTKDGSPCGASKGQTVQYPVIVNTKNGIVFDSSDKNTHVIAYGQLVFTTTTDGTGMVEFEIPLTYRNNTRPSYIVLTAAASRYGDFFTGGPSNMWLDDLELVY